MMETLLQEGLLEKPLQKGNVWVDNWMKWYFIKNKLFAPQVILSPMLALPFRDYSL